MLKEVASGRKTRNVIGQNPLYRIIDILVCYFYYVVSNVQYSTCAVYIPIIPTNTSNEPRPQQVKPKFLQANCRAPEGWWC